MQKLTPFLWFDGQAEDAVNFYTSVFKDSQIGSIVRHNKESAAASGQQEGSAMTVSFTIAGMNFAAINGGPHFKFTEAVSFVINCDSQDEVDYYWEKLTKDGDENAQQCGWLKDKYGLSWQIVPTVLPELLNSSDHAKSQRVMAAILQMKKIDIEKLQQAFNG